MTFENKRFNAAKEQGYCDHGNTAETCSTCIDKKEQEDEQRDKNEKERDIQKFLLSEKFKELLRECPDAMRESMVGFALEYYLYDPAPDHASRYLEELIKNANESGGDQNHLSRKYISLMIKHLFANKKFDTETERGKKEAFLYINKLVKNSPMYHGFNGTFKESIRKNGLETETRLWKWDDLESINNLLKRVGVLNGLGWAHINCRGKISLGDSPENIYRYGIASPEWFAQFVAEGWHIPNNPPYDKKAFYRKDYLAARRNIELFCTAKMNQGTQEKIDAGLSYPNMTDDEKEQLLSFFEEYWKKICGNDHKPAVAIVSKSTIKISTAAFETYEEWLAWASRHQLNSSVENYGEMMLRQRYPDLQISESISPTNITLVDLPTYQEIHQQ